MRPDNPIRHFAIALFAAVLIYTVSYGWIEHRRHRKGPWEVTFGADSNGIPKMIINQPRLGITNFQILFTAEKLPSTMRPGATILFATPRNVPFDVPYGKCIFADLTFLPGTVTFSNVFGHEIELMPRVLIIDFKERPWTSGNLEVPRAATH